MVPEKPPPMIATGTRSDFIIGPALRVRGIRFPRLDVIVNAGDGLACRLGKPSRDRGMDQGGATRADQLGADLDRARTVARPAHPERTRMLDEQPPHRSGRCVAWIG